MITLEQAKQLKTGQIIYHTTNRNSDKTAQRWKVTSVKTWKRDSSKVCVGLKHGLKSFDTLTENDLNLVSLEDNTK